MTGEDLVTEYLAAIDSGQRVAGKLERAAVARYRRDLELGEQRGLVFDKAAAERAVRFIHTLELTEGEYAGQQMKLRPWQAFIVWNLFGWKVAATGYRRFRKAFVSVGRGNGKTPFGAAIALLVTGFDSPMEPENQGYATATKGDQAKIAFRQAKSFVENSTNDLRKYAVTFAHHIEFPKNRGRFGPIASDGKSADGFNPGFILRDEFHAWGEIHREFNDRLETALNKRRQPLMLTITTAGDDQSELWLAEHNFASLVVQEGNGVEADDLFAFICEIDGEPGDPPEEIDDPLDERCWPKANPMLEYGVVKIDGLRSMAERAKLDNRVFDQLKRFHCNKLATSAQRLFRAEQWAMGDRPLPWDKIDKGECFTFAALDWGWKDDLCALGWVFDLGVPEGQEKRQYGVHVDVWLPAGGRRQLDKSPWREWIRDGWVTVTDGKSTDTGAIYRTFAERWEMWDIRGVAFDGNNAREWGSTINRQYGLEGYAFPQVYSKYNEPTRELGIAMAEGRVLHGGNPVLAWAAGHAIGRTDGNGLIMPDKARSRDKIDPIVAVVMAFSEAQFHERTKSSFYETNSLEAG